MTTIPIATLKTTAGETPIAATVLAQLQTRHLRTTKNGKPYLELSFADSTSHFSIKVWEDNPCFEEAQNMKLADVFLLTANWSLNSFGFDTKNLVFSRPDENALSCFFNGDPTLRAHQDAQFAQIEELAYSITDPRLHALCHHFLQTHGEHFRRTAAAKRNHHARRGGLVEHVAQMMRAANALCAIYPTLNRDLLLTGTLFHDVGKLWENTYPKCGFTQIHDYRGELLGHIPMGIEFVNRLWRELQLDSIPRTSGALSEEVRLHLLHLIASHHGEYEFGSPVLPKTPEAFTLHYIDNLDAKLEMAAAVYANSQEIAPNIFERAFPLPTNLILPLPHFAPPSAAPSESETDS